MATGDGLYRGEEDKSAVFFVDVGNRKGDLNVQVDGMYYLLSFNFIY